MAADNLIRVTIDTTLFHVDTDAGEYETFKIWHIYPRYFTKGVYNFTIEGQDDGEVATGFGLEVYDNSEGEIAAATCYNELNLLFSTKDIIGDTIPSTYSCPLGYKLANGAADSFVCRSSVPLPRDTVVTENCYSLVKDTAVNPYISGILGNWRASRSYAHYARRAETSPAAATNIRKNGAFGEFTSFWKFQSGKLVAQYDTAHWVWNSESTLFSRKGFEVENKDPLGRYNSGQYGYNLTTPVSMVQNSRLREAAFEGFEDYGFITQTCDTACPVGRHIDFSTYKSNIDTTQKHTGKASLRVPAGETVGIGFNLVPAADDTIQPRLNISVKQVCANTVLDKIKTSDRVLLPVFKPVPGRRMLISAWVKEAEACAGTSYVNNRIRVVFGQGSSSIEFKPTGNIIEGWQRYEGVFVIPQNVTTLSVSLEATAASAAYFDDLRIHPFNANMKSFVFHPVNMRLMAELDENNYTTLYEYDDEGTLIRTKKKHSVVSRPYRKQELRCKNHKLIGI
ncbi:hypothetical protein [Paraflavitalea speifideaquila]|uniref:hypothetical protein n=1 Tax=Paraflavitalea speifideaquila TaxID=3076558 RepID=UPI0028E6479E|nr:hypothetical protein [Paraflavitalea speifideiaquila]